MAKQILIYGSIGYDWWTGGGITGASFKKEFDEVFNLLIFSITLSMIADSLNEVPITVEFRENGWGYVLLKLLFIISLLTGCPTSST